MTEQKQTRKEISQRRQGQRNKQSGIQQPDEQNDAQREVEKRLQELDTAIDDILTASTSGPSIVVGHQQSHQIQRPLTNEELVRGFRQARGE
jgi:hypothetical protein